MLMPHSSCLSWSNLACWISLIHRLAFIYDSWALAFIWSRRIWMLNLVMNVLVLALVRTLASGLNLYWLVHCSICHIIGHDSLILPKVNICHIWWDQLSIFNWFTNRVGMSFVMFVDAFWFLFSCLWGACSTVPLNSLNLMTNTSWSLSWCFTIIIHFLSRYIIGIIEWLLLKWKLLLQIRCHLRW